MKKWIEYQLNNKNLTLPVLSYPVIQKLDINIVDFLIQSDNQTKGMKYLADNFPLSAAITPMDLSIEAEVMGAEIQYFDYEIPTVKGRTVESQSDIVKLNLDINKGRINTVIDTIRKAKNEINNKAVLGGVIGPYSLAGRLMDMTEIMINCYEEPETVHMLLEKCALLLIDYIKKLKDNGADGVFIAEPAAGLLSPAICEEFSSRYLKKIIAEVNSDNFIIIYHNCGNVVPLWKSIASINADAYHFGNAIDIEEMLKIMPNDKLIMGNINPVMFKDSMPEEIENQAVSLLQRCGKYSNFVISTGCDIPAAAKWENINAYFEAVTEFYKK